MSEKINPEILSMEDLQNKVKRVGSAMQIALIARLSAEELEQLPIDYLSEQKLPVNEKQKISWLDSNAAVFREAFRNLTASREGFFDEWKQNPESALNAVQAEMEHLKAASKVEKRQAA